MGAAVSWAAGRCRLQDEGFRCRVLDSGCLEDTVEESQQGARSRIRADGEAGARSLGNWLKGSRNGVERVKVSGIECRKQKRDREAMKRCEG